MQIKNNRTFFNEKAASWDEITNHNEDKIRYFIRKLNLKDQENLLDVGTGTGILIPYLFEANDQIHITAIDIAENMINKARAKYSHLPVNFIIADITDSNIPTQFYDAIILYSVFPHLGQPKKILQKLSSLLKASGRIIICHSQSRQVINGRHQQLKGELISKTLPPANELAKIFAETTLEVIEQEDNSELYYLLAVKKK